MSLAKQMLSAFFLLAGLLFVVAMSALSPQAAAAELPPRPTAIPTTTPITAVGPVRGGFIQLHYTTTQDKSSLWTAVQWQDAHDAWHTVEGWQGSFNPDGMVTWWVAPEDLGKGPFRWQLFDGQEGNLLAVSEAFTLPESNGQLVQIEALAPPR